jgi:glutathione peroxidase
MPWANAASAGAAAGQQACPLLLQHTFPRLQDDRPVSLCEFAGKVLLIVNTASYCGFTPQYEGLERLHGRFASRGLVIMGFPSNDFGQQEPGTSAQIGQVCFNTYGVRFPMFSKIPVAGEGAHPLFKALAQSTGEPPRWNFHKYLVDRSGRALASYPSRVAPESSTLVRAIEKALSGQV